MLCGSRKNAVRRQGTVLLCPRQAEHADTLRCGGKVGVKAQAGARKCGKAGCFGKAFALSLVGRRRRSGVGRALCCAAGLLYNSIEGDAWSMTLPNEEAAFVEERKITHYLLSFESEDGQHKAAFFVRFGFSADAWQDFADALCQHGRQNEVVSITDREQYGKLYLVEGSLVTPDGRNPLIRTVWEITNENTAPRLVTAYPL